MRAELDLMHCILRPLVTTFILQGIFFMALSGYDSTYILHKELHTCNTVSDKRHRLADKEPNTSM